MSICIVSPESIDDHCGFAVHDVHAACRYGHLTWEWGAGIRSYLHPLLFAAPLQVRCRSP